MKKRRGKKKSAPKYYSWDLAPIIAEMERLEMQSLLHESDEAFRMMMQAEETRPEDLDCKEAEEDFIFRPGHLGTP